MNLRSRDAMKEVFCSGNAIMNCPIVFHYPDEKRRDAKKRRKILEKLCGGDTGVAYRPEDFRLERTVRLKFFPLDLTRNEEAKRRFIHEPQAMSALQPINICTIQDIDEVADKLLFIATDCCEGETLKSRIARGQLQFEEALDIAAQVAQGLGAVHERGFS